MISPVQKLRYLSRFGFLGLLALTIGLPLVATGTEDAAGRYAIVQTTVSKTKLPILSDVVATTRAVMLVDLDQDGNRLYGGGQLCHLQLTSTSSLVNTSFPKAFIRALPPIVFEAHLETRQDQPYLVSSRKTLVLGAHLDNPKNDKLPHSAEDSRVYDQDSDGHPGMTVRVSGVVSGEVYVVQRSSTQMAGPKTRRGFAGGVHFELEQNIVGASRSMLRRGPRPIADSSASRFEMLKMPISANCEEAVAVVNR